LVYLLTERFQNDFGNLLTEGFDGCLLQISIVTIEIITAHNTVNAMKSNIPG
jgi:hypothetical protein